LNISGQDLRNEWVVFDQEYIFILGKKDRPFYSYNQSWILSFGKVYERLDSDADTYTSITTIIDDMTHRPLFCDTLSCLRLLMSSYRIAVLSNSDDRVLYPVVNRLEVKFDEVMSSEEAYCYKLSPKIFHDMLARLQVSS
jgi:FMN phosphatase YigB (HAD superfamily)